ncbi:MAG TPA: glycosyltransferase family 2 protein [Pyrinomonadaceae bacterium]|nr:glycosyltransferase family 2 protein [Pyrinomonadaceae bacterium]
MPLQSYPEISVIVPVYNAGPHLRKCLEGLIGSDFPEFEVLVVDDASTDGDVTAESRAYGFECLRLDERAGPAAARNHGARYARGSILFFVDADIVVRKDTLSRTAALFRARPNVAAAFGSYDDAPAETNFFSQYKNLQHHFVHQQSSSHAETFWAGCGAVRREVFQSAGGFDAGKYQKPSIEDIELGYRLRRKGCLIALDHALQVKHLKRWTFLSVLHTDIFDRALPWSQLILQRDGMINDLNLRASDRFSAALTGLAVGLLLLSSYFPILLAALVAALITLFFLNFGFYSFLRMHGGMWFAIRGVAMLALYYFYSGVVFTVCYGSFLLGKRISLAGTARKAGEVS